MPPFYRALGLEVWPSAALRIKSIYHRGGDTDGRGGGGAGGGEGD